MKLAVLLTPANLQMMTSTIFMLPTLTLIYCQKAAGFGIMFTKYK